MRSLLYVMGLFSLAALRFLLSFNDVTMRYSSMGLFESLLLWEYWAFSDAQINFFPSNLESYLPLFLLIFSPLLTSFHGALIMHERYVWYCLTGLWGAVHFSLFFLNYLFLRLHDLKWNIVKLANSFFWCFKYAVNTPSEFFQLIIIFNSRISTHL